MLIQRECLLALISFLSITISIPACKEQQIESPPGYDLGNPIVMNFGKNLEEISGINFINETGTLLAISDNKEKVYGVNPKTSKLTDYTEKVVPPDSDLEDIVKVGKTVYIMASKGILYEIPDGVKDSSGITKYEFPNEGPNDFESLYYDSSANGLVLLCKSCAFEKGKKMRSSFLFNLETKSFDSTVFYSISREEIKAVIKDEDAKFDPSAAAINPIDNKLYILSSAGNLLIVTDTKGKVLEGYRINPDQFPQAEGIAFAPNGTMFITNEGKYGTATLYIFPYKNPQKKK